VRTNFYRIPHQDHFRNRHLPAGPNGRIPGGFERAGWLVISDTWYPGWRAWLDGEPAEIYRADYLFAACTAGEHRVRMIMCRSFYAGLYQPVITHRIDPYSSKSKWE
jgi:hypothetical protein